MVKSSEITEVMFTPGQPGQYRIHCPVNNLEATLVVRELPSERGDRPADRVTASESGAFGEAK